MAADDDRPEVNQDDSVEQGAAPHQRISDSPAGLLLQAFLEDMHSSDEDSQEALEESRDRLRKNAAEVVVEIARGLGTCPEDDYELRWSLVHAAAELHDRAALPLLRTLVLTPIPPERSPDPHSFTTVGEETILRTTAIDGLAALTREGDEEVIETMFDFLNVPSISVRRAAVQALLQSPQADDLRGRIADCLPKEQHYLLEIRPADVREVEQIPEPQQHLSEAGRAADKAEPPRFDAVRRPEKKRKSPKAGPVDEE